jgi:hypothetical protein
MIVVFWFTREVIRKHCQVTFQSTYRLPTLEALHHPSGTALQATDYVWLIREMKPNPFKETHGTVSLVRRSRMDGVILHPLQQS